MSLQFFEADQTKLAVRLWAALKKANGAGFEVIQFSQNWGYADNVLTQCLQVPDKEVAQICVELMQLRELFVRQEPHRARKLGAPIASDATAPASAKGQPAAGPTEPAPLTPEQIKAQYLKGLR